MQTVRRRLRNASKLAMRKVFEQGQRLGVDVLPRHFYSELPNIRALRGSQHWRAPYSMVGISGVEPDSQLAFVRECCSDSLIRQLTSKAIHTTASSHNGEVGFGEIEADFLYAFVATKKPRQIFQIGCGVSTAVCLMAAQDAGYQPDVICVEPYPTQYLLREAAAGRITLLRERVELLDLQVVENLGTDLLFFVDSTHTLGPAGEVSRIILEMLPRLKAAAYVHFHDITFPYDYSRHTLTSALFFQHESVLLQAFLTHNSRFRILASLSMLHYLRPAALAECLPNYCPAENDAGLAKGGGHFPSSTYLQAVA
jgi:hypothetical protein